MKSTCLIRFASCFVLFGLSAVQFPARAQKFSDWSAPVNLGPVINFTESNQHPAISKDGLTSITAQVQPTIWTSGCRKETILLKSECDVCAPDPGYRLRTARCRLCVGGVPRSCAEDHILPSCLLVNSWHAL
jgi:hypothetical protein